MCDKQKGLWTWNPVQSIKQTINHWQVEDVSIFLKYCCPGCEYNNENLSKFEDHAVENHENSLALFFNQRKIKVEKLNSFEFYDCKDISAKSNEEESSQETIQIESKAMLIEEQPHL